MASIRFSPPKSVFKWSSIVIIELHFKVISQYEHRLFMKEPRTDVIGRKIHHNTALIAGKSRPNSMKQAPALFFNYFCLCCVVCFRHSD